MNAEELAEEYKQCFEFYDKTGKGTLSKQQIEEILNESCPKLLQKDRSDIMANVNEAGLNLESFKKLFMDLCTPKVTSAQIQQAFEVFDKSKTGKASKGEIEYVLVNLGKSIEKSEIDGFLALAEADADGAFDYNILGALLCSR